MIYYLIYTNGHYMAVNKECLDRFERENIKFKLIKELNHKQLLNFYRHNGKY